MPKNPTSLTRLPWILALLAACAARPPHPTAPALPPIAALVADGTKIYTGADGVEVALARLADGSFLLRVKGTTSPLDGKVLPCTVDHSSDRRTVYQTTIDGRSYRPLHVEHGSSSYGTGVRLFFPGLDARDGVALSYDETRSRAFAAAPLREEHLRQRAAGELAAIQRFDRAGARQRAEAGLAEQAAATAKSCEARLSTHIDWSTIDDATLQTYAIDSFCSAPLEALAHLCRSPAARAAVARDLTGLDCRFGAAMALERANKLLRWTTATGAANAVDFAREQLGEKVRFSGTGNLAQRRFVEETAICSGGREGTLVGWRPARAATDEDSDAPHQLFFGTARELRLVPAEEQAGEGWFFDPRFFAPSRAENFRGLDLRYYSFLELDRDKGRCLFTCGARKVTLQLLDAAATARLAAQATFAPPLPRRQPHGLARDRRGTYYFVDRGAEAGARDFRLWAGPLGKLKLLAMTNVVSDTRGDVFATRDGSLRLALEQTNSYWMQGKRSTELLNVPIADNWQLIYNELGVYLGEPYGTPCDRL